MTDYKTTADHAREIRQAIKKAHGYTARQVSVRTSLYSMGSSIIVTIKDPAAAADFDSIEEIAESHAQISRCEITHEILSGGNMFVHMGYSRDCETAIAAPFRAAVDAAIEALPVDDFTSYHAIGDTGVSVLRHSRTGVALSTGRHFWNHEGDTNEAIALDVAKTVTARS